MRLRIYSHAGGRSGYARAANDYALALHRAGVELELRPLDREPVFEGTYAPLAALVRVPGHGSPSPDVVMVHTLPLDCHRVLEVERQAGLLDSQVPAVAYTTWEAQTSPPELMQLLERYFQWTIVPSMRTGMAIGNWRLPIKSKIRVLPHTIDEESLASRKGPGYSATRPGKPYTFYYMGAWNNRKNPHGVIRAFGHAFTAGEAELVLHCPGVSMDVIAREIASLGMPVTSAPKIWPSTRYLDEASIIDFHATKADCFVTAARGEAWNLPAFEAICAGRPVISPYGLGSDDYLHGTDSVLYKSMRTIATCDMDAAQVTSDGARFEVNGGIAAQGITAKVLWLEPDLVALAEYMQHAVKHASPSVDHRTDIAATYGYAAVAKQAITILESAIS